MSSEFGRNEQIGKVVNKKRESQQYVIEFRKG